MADDLELVQRFKAGDEAAFDELVRRYQQRVYALLYRMVRSTEDACELAQDVFVRAYRALPRFEARSSFYTWLYRIAANQAISFLRRRRPQTVPIASDELETGAIMNLPAKETPAAAFRSSQLRRAIDQAVTVLPARQRTVFVMRQYQGLSNREISEALGCAEGSVKASYFFAIRKLQALLKDWGQSMGSGR